MKLERDIPLAAAAALALATACGSEEDPEAPYVFPEAEPCADVKAVCADAESSDGETMTVTGVTEGVTDCHDKGWTVVVAATPVNVNTQNTDSAGTQVTPDVGDHSLLPPEELRVQRVTQDGSYSLEVADLGNAYQFAVERYSPAVMQACECWAQAVKDVCAGLGFKDNAETGVSGKAQAQNVCLFGRPGHEDIQYDTVIAYKGTVPNSGRNSCLNVPLGQTREALRRTGTIDRRMIPAFKGAR